MDKPLKLEAGQRIKVRKFGTDEVQVFTVLKAVTRTSWLCLNARGRREIATTICIRRAKGAIAS